MKHIEVHVCETARDAAELARAGLPRYDLEKVQCGSCPATVGEIFNPGGETVAWRPFAVVLNGEKIVTVCMRCIAGIDKALKNG